MKRFALLITALLLCGIAAAHTINWHVDGNIYQTTTCDSGESITPPTPPYKYGYHLKKWKPEYTPIEYLQSTGTQYIDTGYYPNQDTTMDIVYRGTGGSAASRWISSGGSFGIWNADDSNTVIYYKGDTYTRVYVADKKRVTITPEKIYVNDGLVLNYTHGSWQSSLSIYLFGWNDNGTFGVSFSGKIYSAAFYDGNTLVRDFIPVLDFNEVPCMYDRIEHRYYYNAGTGQFIAGPVLQ